LTTYRVLITHEIFNLENIKRKEKDRILNYFRGLVTDPSQHGDYQENDDVGRPVQIKILGDYAITFSADNAVSEVKVTKIEKADQK
jgi:mRNA-degrading endonuclease RelE of RelBE toxin-antitoxin system